MTRGRERTLRVGFIEPHLGRFGGHPPDARVRQPSRRPRPRRSPSTCPTTSSCGCTWMRCDAAIKPVRDGFDDPLDVVVFNHEPQWHLLDRFRHADRRIFYALHYGSHLREGGQLGERAHARRPPAREQQLDRRPDRRRDRRPADVVQLGGVNREVFQPYGGRKRYAVLCIGDTRREWKGTDTVIAAGPPRSGVPRRGLRRKDLDQPALGREYDAAAGLRRRELVRGVLPARPRGPGVRGPARHDRQRRLPRVRDRRRDRAGRAAARRRRRWPTRCGACSTTTCSPASSPPTASTSSTRDFDWERRTDELAEVLDGVVRAAPPPRPSAPAPAPTAPPDLSVVVLAWDNLVSTQHFVESVRRHTDVPYELIVVDNGSEWEAANYADRPPPTAPCSTPRTVGFAQGMNQGLAVATGDYVAFCNNDTVLPRGWAEPPARDGPGARPRAAIVVPALHRGPQRGAPCGPSPAADGRGAAAVLGAAAGDPVRDARGEVVARARRAGARSTRSPAARTSTSASRRGPTTSTSSTTRGCSSSTWGRDRRRGSTTGRGCGRRTGNASSTSGSGDGEVPYLGTCDEARFARNREVARAAAGWMRQYFRQPRRAAPPPPATPARARGTPRAS